MKNFMMCALMGIVLLFLMLGLFRAQEMRECSEWKKYEDESAKMGLVSYPWQKAQCEHYGIKINY